MCKNQKFYITVYARHLTVSNEPVGGAHYEQWFYVDRCFYLVGKAHRSVNMTKRYDAIANLAMNHALSLGMSVSAMKYVNRRGRKHKRSEKSEKRKGLFDEN